MSIICIAKLQGDTKPDIYDKPRAIERMRPCAASLYRHRFAPTLLERAGLEVPDKLPPQPEVYPDLHHAVDWDAAVRACQFVPDQAVEAMVVLGSGREICERAQALAELDVDAIWWRDEGSYAPPEALMSALERDVLPHFGRE